jgi:hypothetical protein
LFYFVFLLPFHHVRWWLWEILPCSSVSLYGERRLAWKMGCTFFCFHCRGRSNRKETGLITLITLNGPYRFGASFCVGCEVWRFFPSNQTRSPSLYGSYALCPFCFTLRFMTIFCAFLMASWAQSLVTSNHSLRWARSGRVEVVFVCHMLGVCPMRRLNGVILVTSLGQALCTNWARGSKDAQLFCWKFPYTLRYCSSHWFVLSDCPSI